MYSLSLEIYGLKFLFFFFFFFGGGGAAIQLKKAVSLFVIIDFEITVTPTSSSFFKL